MIRLLTLACAALFILTAHSPASQARELAEPQYIAVYFYADWCPNCKTLSPKLDQVRTQDELDKSDILFVKLDLTDKPRIHQSILLAQSIGIGDYLKQQGSSTGYIAILDAKTKQEKHRLTAPMPPEEISKIFKSLENL